MNCWAEEIPQSGGQVGYNDVDAQFVSFEVRWQRSGHWTDFKVSDYLSDVLESVVIDLAETTFGKTCSENSGYS